MEELVLIIDFGGQYNQLIARRVRECNVYCEVVPYTITISEIINKNPKGIILTGGPNSVYLKDSPKFDKQLFTLGIPILGICYGCQLMAYQLGGVVDHCITSEYGKTILSHLNDSLLFHGVSKNTIMWMSHTDSVKSLPDNYQIIGKTENCPIAAFADEKNNLYGVQFHPEVTHSKEGKKIFLNFLKTICHCKGTWKPSNFIKNKINELRQEIGDGKVLLALSGGVDSSVAAALLARTIGKNLTCVFIDHGLLRKGEADEVEAIFTNKSKFDLNFKRINCADDFFDKLKNKIDPEVKRKTIGSEFIRAFETVSKAMGTIDFLAQGTIYPDLIESGLGNSATIKSHHNVGGLPKVVKFKKIIEPLRQLFKDEVRKIGLLLSLPKELINRQPFPGPGLGVRVIGEVTREKVEIVQEADFIFRQELASANLDHKISQYYAALSSMKLVGVKGDFRTYDYSILLRAVTTDDFMTAEAYPLPHKLLKRVTNRILNEVNHVNRVFYDCTDKPPGTIEME